MSASASPAWLARLRVVGGGVGGRGWEEKGFEGRRVGSRRRRRRHRHRHDARGSARPERATRAESESTSPPTMPLKVARASVVRDGAQPRRRPHRRHHRLITHRHCGGDPYLRQGSASLHQNPLQLETNEEKPSPRRHRKLKRTSRLVLRRRKVQGRGALEHGARVQLARLARGDEREEERGGDGEGGGGGEERRTPPTTRAKLAQQNKAKDICGLRTQQARAARRLVQQAERAGDVLLHAELLEEVRGAEAVQRGGVARLGTAAEAVERVRGVAERLVVAREAEPRGGPARVRSGLEVAEGGARVGGEERGVGASGGEGGAVVDGLGDGGLGLGEDEGDGGLGEGGGGEGGGELGVGRGGGDGGEGGGEGGLGGERRGEGAVAGRGGQPGRHRAWGACGVGGTRPGTPLASGGQGTRRAGAGVGVVRVRLAALIRGRGEGQGGHAGIEIAGHLGTVGVSIGGIPVPAPAPEQQRDVDVGRAPHPRRRTRKKRLTLTPICGSTRCGRGATSGSAKCGGDSSWKASWGTNLVWDMHKRRLEQRLNPFYLGEDSLRVAVSGIVDDHRNLTPTVPQPAVFRPSTPCPLRRTAAPSKLFRLRAAGLKERSSTANSPPPQIKSNAPWQHHPTKRASS
ncbi:hypothetical protein C8F04DRAFT_1322123 [Mycena alexandri]|uniref:Uncharacterized protein n=1 Tax=Mycena alexandri TaxID=1745969 RepID=A0AAD6WNL9_9AGAR|nr:hypothetical protein C8F04DRAFT_1322123 [Mycena alexandri]